LERRKKKMAIKKIIPCMDINKGRVVKGVNFVNLIDAGDPVENAAFYVKEGADELVFLDITATTENRKTIVDLAAKVAKKVTIPFTVGGGIRSVEDIQELLNAGVNKVGINSAAFNTPELISNAAEKFGSQCVIVAIDAGRKTNGSGWDTYISGGQKNTGKDAVEWAIEAEKLGAGEILLTSLDRDGTKDGYDIELTRAVAERVKIPVTASGGAGKKEDFKEALTEGKAAAALAASLFHFREIEIGELKRYLKREGLEVN